MKHLLTISFFAASLLWFGCGNAQTSTSDATASVVHLKADEFVQKMQDAPGTVLDVRTPGEVAQGVIEGAVHINIYDADFAARAAELDKTKPVYVYCKVGGRSSKACDQLIDMGYTEVYNLDGGITGWQRAGNQVVAP